MSEAQTKSQHEWRKRLQQERVDYSISLLRSAQHHLHEGRVHNMPQVLIASSERMVKLRLNALWDAQQGLEQLKLAESYSDT